VIVEGGWEDDDDHKAVCGGGSNNDEGNYGSRMSGYLCVLAGAEAKAGGASSGLRIGMITTSASVIGQKMFGDL